MPYEDPFVTLFNSIKYQTLRLADSIDAHFDSLANTLREKAADSTWIPESAKPAKPFPPPVPPSTLLPLAAVSTYHKVSSWVQENKWKTICITAAGVGTAAWVIRRHRAHQKGKKRKAARSTNGARKDVVVVHGNMHDPVVKSMTLDLEKKGFIVYVIVSTVEGEQAVHNESRADIKPLNIDILDTSSAQASVEKFAHHLRTPLAAFPGAQAHHLRLVSLILITDNQFPTGPIETIPLDHWSDTFNLKIIQTLAITQLFLPLLNDFKYRILFITPSIPQSLNLPFHAPEVASVSALGGLVTALRRELKSSDARVIWIKTGTFDVTSSQRHTHANSARADVLMWTAHMRATYAREYTSQRSLYDVKGTSVKELHAAVFDAMTSRRTRDIIRVGSGSVVYDMIGKLGGENLVSWMLGLRSRSNATNMEDSSYTRALVRSPPGSSGSSSGGLESSVEWEKVDKMV